VCCWLAHRTQSFAVETVMLGWRARVSSFEECRCLVQFGPADVVGPSGDRFSRCFGTGQTAVSQIQGCGRTSGSFLTKDYDPAATTVTTLGSIVLGTPRLLQLLSLSRQRLLLLGAAVHAIASSVWFQNCIGSQGHWHWVACSAGKPWP